MLGAAALTALTALTVTMPAPARAQTPSHPTSQPPSHPAPHLTSYRNPLPLRLPDGALAQNCADPAVLRDPAPAIPTWYLYCTMDPLSRAERDGAGWRFHMMPVYRSRDLVHWDYVRDAFETRPSVAAPTAGLWAPEPAYFDGRYYLYFTVTDVADDAGGTPGCANDSAIAVATSASPTGPWETRPRPLVAPRAAGAAGAGCTFDWTFDPKVVAGADGARYLYYGSYGGGIFVQRLSDDGLETTHAALQVGASGRYEGAEVVQHDGAWYLFASATNCCNGPLTGYALFVGRAATPEGPFLDRDGNDMASYRAGGTLFLAQNGNRWVGSGHNTVFQDAAGQWWTIYHAIDRNDPYFSVPDRLTRRLAMLDRVDWIDGWPVAARAAGPSDSLQSAPNANLAPAPAPAPASASASAPVSTEARALAGAAPLWTERFRARTLGARWRWVRPPPRADWHTGSAGLRLATRKTDLHQDTNTASVLSTALPHAGSYRVEARLRLDAPDGCCADPVQAGLVLYGDDDRYIKLVELAYQGLRQVELAKETVAPAPGYPRYGNTVLGAPGAWTWLRLDVTRGAGQERYSAWSSQDGVHWNGGATWTHALGRAARLGLVAMGGEGYHATFDSVALRRLAP